MAKFKVGDRVRVVDVDPSCWIDKKLVGDTGTIRTSGTERDWIVDLDNNRPIFVGGWMEFDSCHLAPLTPPAIDQWAAEQVKRVTKPQPTTELPKVKA